MFGSAFLSQVDFLDSVSHYGDQVFLLKFENILYIHKIIALLVGMNSTLFCFWTRESFLQIKLVVTDLIFHPDHLLDC